jgi:hypothetical protein
MAIFPDLFESDKSEPIEDGFIQFGPGKGLVKQTFKAKDSNQIEVTKIVTIDKSRGKIILIQPADKSLYLSGIREHGVIGYLYLFAHASPGQIQGMSSADAVANVIKKSGIWAGEPIIIDACRAGQVPDGIASKLASNLHTYVIAPSTITWNYPLGGSAVGQGAFEELPGKWASLRIPNIFRPGSWGIWGPDGKPVASARSSPRDRGLPLPAAQAQEFLQPRR